MSLKLVPKGPIEIIPSLVQIIDWRLPGDTPLPKSMMARLLTHICVTRPQWVDVTSRPVFRCNKQVKVDLRHIYTFKLQSEKTPTLPTDNVVLVSQQRSAVRAIYNYEFLTPYVRNILEIKVHSIFCNIVTAKVIEILRHEWQGPTYPTCSTPWY